MDISHFELIDDVLSLDSDLRALRAAARVPDRHALFDGHFPGRPLLPGTVQTELMAQAAGLLGHARRSGDGLLVLAGIDRARFRREVSPGATLEIRAALDYEGGRLSVFACSVHDDAGPVSDAVIRLAAVPAGDAATIAWVAERGARTGLDRLVGAMAR
jgi:3-hydroxyacyl-[acyl-carrier-protein] dehydratase